jgi:hypothetical protein
LTLSGLLYFVAATIPPPVAVLAQAAQMLDDKRCTRLHPLFLSVPAHGNLLCRALFFSRDQSVLLETGRCCLS